MQPITRDAFLALPWSDSVRQRVADALKRSAAVSAHREGRRLRAIAWPDIPDDYGPDVVAVCLRVDAPEDADGRSRTLADAGIDRAVAADAKKGPSRTAKALALLDAGSTMTEAARAAGIGLPTLSNAVKRRQTLPRCPHCGQTIRPTYPPSGE